MRVSSLPLVAALLAGSVSGLPAQAEINCPKSYAEWLYGGRSAADDAFALRDLDEKILDQERVLTSLQHRTWHDVAAKEVYPDSAAVKGLRAHTARKMNALRKLQKKRAELSPESSYETLPLTPGYIGEQVGLQAKASSKEGKRIRYLSAEERAQYEIRVNELGLLVDAKGKILETRGMGPKGEYIFVMDAQGKMYAAPWAHDSELAPLRDSSFTAGMPVAAAGTIKVHGGKLVHLRRGSPRYLPSVRYMQQAVRELEKRGAEVPANVIQRP